MQIGIRFEIAYCPRLSRFGELRERAMGARIECMINMLIRVWGPICMRMRMHTDMKTRKYTQQRSPDKSLLGNCDGEHLFCSSSGSV